jgi:hypothetical protein
LHTSAQRPQLHNGDLILQPRLPLGRVCNVRTEDGETRWCENKGLITQAAINNSIGYAIDLNTQLIGFQLSDGEVLEVIRFSGSVDFSQTDSFHVAVCDKHLLAYFADTHDLFWFSFNP